jgi:AraC family transcriptional regulator, regulatory protein of adaptative response / methylated-DNA-[protein]-cysteine methyltransferase
MTDYERIAKAIYFLHVNFKEQPGLEELSEHVGLSVFHFQRMFKEWAGVSPKKFLQFISIEHAKKLLSSQLSVSEASFETGLSGTSRLHDLFVSIEGMTPGEFKNGGAALSIKWEMYNTPFGEVIVGSTTSGICYLAFTDSGIPGFEEMKTKFPQASFRKEKDPVQASAIAIFDNNPKDLDKIKLHLKGTPFQLKVWEALLKIPLGGLTTYSGLAKSIGSPGASRAVGSAVGDNPVAYLIPCHRVIRSTGLMGEYHWGCVRKTAIIGRESAKIYGEME